MDDTSQDNLEKMFEKGSVGSIADLVEANGKTVRQNNLELIHDIPIGTLVEIIDQSEEDGETSCIQNFLGVRMFVACHGRDCDGEPLYSLTHDRDYCDDRIGKDGYGEERTEEYIGHYRRLYQHGGWNKESLMVITPNHKRDIEQTGYEEALRDVADIAKLSPHLVKPIFIPAIEGLAETRLFDRKK